jgi:hypothetical protein
MVEALGWHAARTKSSLEPSIFILLRPREVHLRTPLEGKASKSAECFFTGE